MTARQAQAEVLLRILNVRGFACFNLFGRVWVWKPNEEPPEDLKPSIAALEPELRRCLRGLVIKSEYVEPSCKWKSK